jgi:hypothetical protein
VNPDDAQFNLNRSAIDSNATAKRLPGRFRDFLLNPDAVAPTTDLPATDWSAQTQIGERRKKATARYSCTLQAGERRVNAGSRRCEQAVIPVADTPFFDVLCGGKKDPREQVRNSRRCG